MGILSKPRTKEAFREKISSQGKGSQEGFFIAIGNFENFCMEKYGKVDIIPDMLKAPENEIIDTLQLWINYLNVDLAASTSIVYFSRLKKYLHYMGIKINDQDVKNELEFRRVPQEELYGLTLEDIHIILEQFNYKTVTQYMCQLSSLMRIGEITKLRKKHLILDKQNIVIKIPSTIAKRNKARTTFFSKEASTRLRPLLRTLADDDLIFAKSNDSRYAGMNSGQMLRRALKKSGLDMKKENGRNMINTHSFRAYGITKLDRHDSIFAKKISGHVAYQGQYDRLDDNEKLALYEKFEYELTIDQTKRDKAKIDQLEADAKVKMEIMARQIESLQATLDEQTKRLDQSPKEIMAKQIESLQATLDEQTKRLDQKD